MAIANPPSSFRGLRNVWVVFTVWTLVYIFIFYRMAVENQDLLREQNNPLVILGMALISLVFAIILPKLISKRPPNIEKAVAFVWVVQWISFEAICINGILLGLMLGKAYFFTFWAVGFLGLIFMKPSAARREHLIKTYQNLPENRRLGGNR